MRPLPITILCGLLLISAFSKLLAFVAHYLPAGIGPALWASITPLGVLVSVLGLWNMKRWGVYLYLGAYAVTGIAFYLSPHPGSGLALSEMVQPNHRYLLFLQQHPWLIVLGRLAGVVVYCAVVLPYWKRLQPMKRVVATPRDDSRK